MVLTKRQAQIFIYQFNILSINQQIFMASPVKYMLIAFEGNINIGYPQGLIIHLRDTMYIDKEAEKLDISVFNAKDIIYHFSV